MKKKRLAPGIVSIFLGCIIILSGFVLGTISVVQNRFYHDPYAFVFPDNEAVWTFFGMYVLLYGYKTVQKRVKENKRAEANVYF